MQKFGCIFILLFIGFLCLELWVVLDLIIRLEDIFLVLASLAALTILGVYIVRFHKTRLEAAIAGNPFAMMQQGGRFIALIGGVLVVIPGFISGAIGLLLQLPPVRGLFAVLGMKIFASVLKRVMGGKMGPGFPSGFPGGFPGGQFPGGFPGGPIPGMKPDDQASLGSSRPKTYDVKPDSKS